MHIKYNYTSYDESGAATPTKFIHQSCFVFCWGCCHEYTEIRGIIFLCNVPSPNNRIMARRKHSENRNPWKVNNCCCLPFPLLGVFGREVPCVLNVCSGRILSFYGFCFYSVLSHAPPMLLHTRSLSLFSWISIRNYYGLISLVKDCCILFWGRGAKLLIYSN